MDKIEKKKRRKGNFTRHFYAFFNSNNRISTFHVLRLHETDTKKKEDAILKAFVDRLISIIEIRRDVYAQHLIVYRVISNSPESSPRNSNTTSSSPPSTCNYRTPKTKKGRKKQGWNWGRAFISPLTGRFAQPLTGHSER